MQRRSFLKNTAISAVAVSASGFIRFDGGHYVGDCETTSDILGPFYRPGSPLRNNLVISGEKGDPIGLSGIIKHDDCTTPYKNAKVELWHCDGDGIYDNESADFKYRGTVYSDDNGRYAFNTILPVPYGQGNNYRPAHFHMMITAEGYQPLVTQLYFVGDPWIEKDGSASSPAAKRRILEVLQRGNSKMVSYDVSMVPKLAAEPAALDRLTGVYTEEKDATKTMELIRKNNQLWLKGDKKNGMPYGLYLEYVHHNTFTFSGTKPDVLSFIFEIIPSGGVKLTRTFTNKKGEKNISVSMKGQ